MINPKRTIVQAINGLGQTIHNVGGRIVGALDDLRAEHARGSANLVQVGQDLNELLDRIATAAEAGDPVASDVAAAKALADGLAETGAKVDAILAEPTPAPEPEPTPPVVEGRNRR